MKKMQEIVSLHLRRFEVILPAEQQRNSNISAQKGGEEEDGARVWKAGGE